jgi:hypothetical protein
MGQLPTPVYWGSRQSIPKKGAVHDTMRIHEGLGTQVHVAPRRFIAWLWPTKVYLAGECMMISILMVLNKWING